MISTVYDDLGLKAGATLPDGSSWQFGWDALSRLRSVTDPTGARAVLEYTANGDLARTVDPTGVVQDFESGPLGLPTLARDADSQVGATWDALGRMVGAVNADGTTSTLVHDACGRVVERVDEHGGCTRLERDAAGRVVRVTQPSGASFSYEYDHLGRWVATISTGGRRYEMRYDSDSRLVGETWPDGQEVSTTFDVCGRITRRVEPGRGTTWFTYDKCGRISSVRDAWYGLRRFTYDDAGQLVSVTNALGSVTRFEYDRMGHRVAMVDAAGGRRTCTYDSMGRVRAMTDQVGRTTRYTYDAAGRVTSRADATGILGWAYGSTGRLERVISRPAGGLEDQGGDAVGQDAGAETIASIVRDIAGRTWSATGPGGRADTLTWDAMGRLVSRSRGDQTIRWTYDADGLRTSMTHPDGSVTRYVYDADEMLAAVEHPALGRLDLQRDWLGRVTRAVAPGVEATWTWGPHGVVAHKVVRDGFVRTTALEYDEQGRVTAQSVDGIRTAFAYDAAGQLTRAVTDEGITTTYTWDALGRLEAGDSDGIVTTYTYDAAGQLLTTTTTDTKNPTTDAGNDPAHNAGATGRAGAGADGGGARRQVLTYDAAGRRVSQDDGTSRREFTWDPRGFLAAYTDTTDGGGAPGSTHTLDVDTLGELAGVDGQGVMWDTAWGGLAQVGHVPVTAVAGVGTGTGGPGGGWLLPERAGHDAAASPWGTGAPGPGLGGLGVTTTGTLTLPGEPGPGGAGGGRPGGGAGLSWLGARVYDPSTHSLLSPDPLEPVLGAGWAGNPYSYAGNDPVNLSDPTGLRPLSDADLQAWNEAHTTGLTAAGSWLANNWKYVAAGIVIGGLATAFLGPVAGGAITGAVIGAWQNYDQQAASGQGVNPWQVLGAGLVGGAAGAIGGLSLIHI